jgi:hypothetical protein
MLFCKTLSLINILNCHNNYFKIINWFSYLLVTSEISFNSIISETWNSHYSVLHFLTTMFTNILLVGFSDHSSLLLRTNTSWQTIVSGSSLSSSCNIIIMTIIREMKYFWRMVGSCPELVLCQTAQLFLCNGRRFVRIRQWDRQQFRLRSQSQNDARQTSDHITLSR